MSMICELATLRTLCAEVYQVVGVLAHAAGVFDTAEVERVLDNLAAAGDGKPLPRKTLLPFQVQAAGPVMPESPPAAISGKMVAFGYAEGVYRAIRAALAKEQGAVEATE